MEAKPAEPTRDDEGDLLDPLRVHPERAAILTDFDGTLSPIVEDWTTAAPLPGTRELLHDLAERYAVVGVISGRPVAFLADQLGTQLRLAGLYGLESVIDGVRVAAEGAEEWRDCIERAVESATSQFGSLVEDKGLSLTVHYRTKPEIAADVAKWAAREHKRTGLELRSAKASVELHPPVTFDKGTVVESAVGALQAACFLGDDVGDLPAFAALDRLRARGVHTVKIGVRTSEAPSVLLDNADVVVEGPLGALEVLRTL
jgi:trehalose 6-phosphate phosphatase